MLCFHWLPHSPHRKNNFFWAESWLRGSLTETEFDNIHCRHFWLREIQNKTELGRFGFLGGCFYTLPTLLSWKISSFEEMDHWCISSFIRERTKDINENTKINRLYFNCFSFPFEKNNCSGKQKLCLCILLNLSCGKYTFWCLWPAINHIAHVNNFVSKADFSFINIMTSDWLKIHILKPYHKKGQSSSDVILLVEIPLSIMSDERNSV